MVRYLSPALSFLFHIQCHGLSLDVVSQLTLHLGYGSHMPLNQTYPNMGMGTHGSMYPGMHQAMHGGMHGGGMYGGMMPSGLGMGGLDPYASLGLGGMGGLGIGIGMGGMMSGMPRSRRNPYHDTYGYGGGGYGGGRGYASPYELYDESMYDDDMYMDDYDDIEDPLLAFLRMQQRGGGRRGGGRRGRRYYGGGGGYGGGGMY